LEVSIIASHDTCTVNQLVYF